MWSGVLVRVDRTVFFSDLMECVVRSSREAYLATAGFSNWPSLQLRLCSETLVLTDDPTEASNPVNT